MWHACVRVCVCEAACVRVCAGALCQRSGRVVELRRPPQLT
jgi:hypothetical protein